MKKIVIALLSSSALIGCSPTYESAAISPAVIAALLAALLTAIVTNYIKNKEYKYEYYKRVIQIRLEAYKIVEKQIAGLAILTVDKSDSKTFMTIFKIANKIPTTETKSKQELDYLGIKLNDFELLREDIEKALAQRLWISDNTISILGKIYEKYNQISIEYSIDVPSSLMALGKSYFKSLTELRIELENAIAKDYVSIHNVPDFLQSKLKSEQIEFSAKPYHYAMPHK